MNSKQKVDKYLTDIKELPPVSKEEEQVITKKAPEIIRQAPKPAALSKVPKDLLIEPEPDKKESIFTFKDITLGVINFVSIVLLIVLLTKLPEKAREYQSERIIETQNQVNPVSQFGNLDEERSKSDKLKALFLDESGVVNFVNEVEKLKSSEGAIKKVTFASQKPLKDSTGLLGIPVIIELKGSWPQIANSLEKIGSLHFLFRPVSIDAGPAKDDSGVIVFNYGGFLYVKDSSIAQ